LRPSKNTVVKPTAIKRLITAIGKTPDGDRAMDAVAKFVSLVMHLLLVLRFAQGLCPRTGSVPAAS
jgi:hypothetical protein